MNKYLFLLDELPPTQSANGICAEKVMGCLAESEAVYVVSWDEPSKSTPDPFKRASVPRKPWDRFASAQKAKSGIFNRLFFLMARIIYRLKRMLLLPLWPAESVSTVYRFYTAAKRLICSEGITHIVAISYPGETLLAMRMLKRRFGSKVKTIMYPLDVTLEGMNHGSAAEKRLSRMFGYRVMRACARYADCVLVLENAERLYKRVFPETEQKNFKKCGIPLLEAINQAARLPRKDMHTGEVHFAYGGNLLYSMRNPTAFLDLLETSNWPTHMTLYFDLYGKADAALRDFWQGRYEKLHIVEHGWVSEKELNQALMDADVLVNIGNREPQLIPSKLFKYMSTGKPIAHMYTTRKDPCIPYLHRYGNSFLINPNETEASMIVEWVLNRKAGVPDITSMFPACVPQYTATIIRNT